MQICIEIGELGMNTLEKTMGYPSLCVIALFHQFMQYYIIFKQRVLFDFS